MALEATVSFTGRVNVCPERVGVEKTGMTPAGRPLIDTVSAALNPPATVRLRFRLPLDPRAMVAVLALSASVNPGGGATVTMTIAVLVMPPPVAVIVIVWLPVVAPGEAVSVNTLAP